MKRRSKIEKRPAVIRQYLAQNIKVLRDKKFADLPNETARNRKLAELSDTTLSHIQRIVKAEQGCGVDMLEALARALDVRPQDLVTPYFTVVDQTEPEPSEPRRRRRAN